MGKDFKPFDMEWCPDCGYAGCRDCEAIELEEGKQKVHHWCEQCGWESYQIYEVIYHGKAE